MYLCMRNQYNIKFYFSDQVSKAHKISIWHNNVINVSEQFLSSGMKKLNVHEQNI